jgi:hypothetical protein
LSANSLQFPFVFFICFFSCGLILLPHNEQCSTIGGTFVQPLWQCSRLLFRHLARYHAIAATYSHLCIVCQRHASFVVVDNNNK